MHCFVYNLLYQASQPSELYYFFTKRKVGFLSVVSWHRKSSLIGTLAFFVLELGDAVTSTTLFGSISPTKHTISTLIWYLLPTAFMQILNSVCPGDVSSLSTLKMRKYSPNRFASILDFCHICKSTSKSSPFPFLHSTWKAFASNLSFLFLIFYVKYPPHGTFLYKNQLCSASGSSFLRFACINFCAKPVSIVFLQTVDNKSSP